VNEKLKVNLYIDSKEHMDVNECKINVGECHSINGWRYIMWMNINEQMMEIWSKVDKF
jgi:hypothetical protein